MTPVERQSRRDARFWGRVDTSAGIDGCWPWLGARDRHGYGKTHRRGQDHSASRVALELSLGRTLEAREVARHSCDNPPCCNPLHLSAGTQAENHRDMVQRGRSVPGRGGPRLSVCRRGLHPLVGTNAMRNGRARTCRACVNDRRRRRTSRGL